MSFKESDSLCAVPINPCVCRCHGRLYDRNHEADIDIANNEELVYKLYARKLDKCYANRASPVFSVSDLRHDLIERARKMTRRLLLASLALFLPTGIACQVGVTGEASGRTGGRRGGLCRDIGDDGRAPRAVVETGRLPLRDLGMAGRSV